MDKILIVSDTHRKNEHYLDIIKNSGPFDRVIHCGDVEGSELTICEAAGCPVEMVMGNNDFFSELPREKEFMLGKYKVWLTHGHNYYVSMDNHTIKTEARARGVDIVMYGHSHNNVLHLQTHLKYGKCLLCTDYTIHLKHLVFEQLCQQF